MNKENEDDRIAWASYYLSKLGEIGVPCVWWDNNVFTGWGEKFGLLDRKNLTYPYSGLLKAMMETVNESRGKQGE